MGKKYQIPKHLEKLGKKYQIPKHLEKLNNTGHSHLCWVWFSNQTLMTWHAYVISHVWLCVTPWIFQARILEWVAISSSRGSSWPRDQTRVSCISCNVRWMLYHCTTWEAQARPYHPIIWMLFKTSVYSVSSSVK